MNHTHKISISDFGARPEKSFDSTCAIQAAVEAAASHPGTIVTVPPGDWTIGAIVLRSGVHLHLEEGATLWASADPVLYPHFSHPLASRMDVFPRRALFFGHGLRDVTLTGHGTIEAGGGHRVFQDGVGDSPDRPYGLHLVDCANIRIEHLVWRNSAYWMMRLFQCRQVQIRGLSIFNHCNLNNDGIDVDSSEEVQIDGCRVDASDDGIVIKSESHQPCRRVVVRNCVVSSHASALKLGTASIGGFEDITFEDCEVRPSESAGMHHVFEYWRGMSGLDVAEVDGGKSRNITFQRIRMTGVANPIFVRLGNRHSTISVPSNRRREDAGPALTPVGPGSLTHITFADIEAVETGPFPSVFAEYEGNPIRQLVLQDVTIRNRVFDRPDEVAVPPDWNPSAYPCVHLLAAGGVLPASGFCFHHVEKVHLENVNFLAGAGDPRPERDCFEAGLD